MLHLHFIIFFNFRSFCYQPYLLFQISLYKLKKHAKRKLAVSVEGASSSSSSEEEMMDTHDHRADDGGSLDGSEPICYSPSRTGVSSPEYASAIDLIPRDDRRRETTQGSDLSESSCDSDSNEEGGNKELFSGELLYSDSQVYTDEYVLAILKVYFENKMSKKCLSDVLMLIDKALPQPNNLPRTKHKLMKFVDDVVGDFVPKIHRYCENDNCMTYIGLWNVTTANTACEVCGSQDNSGLFVENPLPELIKHFLERRKMYKYLQDLSGSTGEPICDIVDGKLYRELNSNRGQYDLTLMWNTDGVPVFKSSNAQLRPLLFTVAELKPSVRNCNVLVAGLWFGKRKPKMSTFLQPFVESLQLLESIGVFWTHPITKEVVISRAIAPLCTVDSQARAPLQNISQWNGEYGCFRCEQNGEGFPRTYPYKAQFPELRKDSTMRQQATEASDKRRVFGVRGPSCVASVPKLDLARSFVPDYMHSVLLGVTRQFVCLWFDSSYHNEEWYLGGKMKQIEKILLGICPPSHISWVPRTIVSRAMWKASEFRNWLLYYSVICVKDFLPKKFLGHWICMVRAIYAMLQDKISSADIRMSFELLKGFLRGIGRLYGQDQYRYNVHLLLHLPEAVKNWGPLWAHSCFMFEKVNGHLLSLIHGTQEISRQLVATNKFVMAYEILKGYSASGDKENGCMNKVLASVGSLPPAVQKAISVFLNDHPESQVCKIYSKVCLKSLGKITSKLYKREVKRDSSFVSFHHDEMEKFGQVECFILYENVGLFCVICEVEVVGSLIAGARDSALKHIFRYRKGNFLAHIEVNNIVQSVINVNSCYLIQQPNLIKKNL
ncbi:uncharacterized protein LOC124167605 [Ischnura elegans]|uniref:uncharacterized protein LOC124167605 n=1 Tax=Ischnura elegans TaxID=197161 RepID=UPI001ED8B8C2|nr:uncharacterized protein LOC124167605 [Ischnura elegans]